MVIIPSAYDLAVITDASASAPAFVFVTFALASAY